MEVVTGGAPSRDENKTDGAEVVVVSGTCMGVILSVGASVNDCSVSMVELSVSSSSSATCMGVILSVGASVNVCSVSMVELSVFSSSSSSLDASELTVVVVSVGDSVATGPASSSTNMPLRLGGADGGGSMVTCVPNSYKMVGLLESSASASVPGSGRL